MKDEPTTVSPYAITPELQIVLDAAEAACAQCKKLVEQVDTAAAQVITLEADVRRLTAERAAEEGELALCEAGDVKRYEKTIERLTAELEAKERELRRVRAKIEVFEGMAPKLDETVAARGAELVVEKSIWMQSVKRALSAELAEAVKPLLGVMAKARAISVSICSAELFDFLAAAYLPDPQDFIRYMTPQNGWYNQGANLLDSSDESQQAEADAIAASLTPMKTGVMAATHHRPYTPLARRPIPYVKKGYTIGWEAKPNPAGSLNKPPASRPLELGETNMGDALV